MKNTLNVSDCEDVFTLSRHLQDGGNWSVIRAVPSKSDGGGIKRATSVYQSFLYSIGVPLSFELAYDGQQTKFQFGLPSSEQMEFRAALTEHYQDVAIEDGEIDPLDIDADDSDLVVDARELVFTHDYWNPLTGMDGGEFEFDPYKDFLNTFSNPTEGPVVLQVVFKAVDDSYWQKRPYLRNLSLHRSIEKHSDGLNEMQQRAGSDAHSQKIREAYQQIVDERDKKACVASIRLVCVGDDDDDVEARADRVQQALNTKFKRKNPPQSLTPAEKSPRQVLFDYFNRDIDESKPSFAVLRKNHNRPVILQLPVLSHLAHLPDGKVNNPSIKWNEGGDTGDFPLDAPSFEETQNNSSD